MSKKKETAGQVYKIKLAGHLDENWTDWFHGMKFSYEQDNTTIISGEITERSCLYEQLLLLRTPGGFVVIRSQH
jgi:hypothetical protein